jgi:hypothetical protein
MNILLVINSALGCNECLGKKRRNCHRPNTTRYWHNGHASAHQAVRINIADGSGVIAGKHLCVSRRSTHFRRSKSSKAAIHFCGIGLSSASLSYADATEAPKAKHLKTRLLAAAENWVSPRIFRVSGSQN